MQVWLLVCQHGAICLDRPVHLGTCSLGQVGACSKEWRGKRSSDTTSPSACCTSYHPFSLCSALLCVCANLLVTIESAGASGGAGAGAGSTAAGQAPALAPADTLLRGLHCVLAPTQSLARTTEAQHKEVFRSLEYILEQLEDESRPKAVLAFIGRWLVHRKFKECPQQVRPSLVCCHTSRCSSSSLSDTSATTLAAASIDFEANLPRGHHPPHPRGRRVSKSYHPGAVRVVLKVPPAVSTQHNSLTTVLLVTAFCTTAQRQRGGSTVLGVF